MDDRQPNPKQKLTHPRRRVRWSDLSEAAESLYPREPATIRELRWSWLAERAIGVHFYRILRKVVALRHRLRTEINNEECEQLLRPRHIFCPDEVEQGVEKIRQRIQREADQTIPCRFCRLNLSGPTQLECHKTGKLHRRQLCDTFARLAAAALQRHRDHVVTIARLGAVDARLAD